MSDDGKPFDIPPGPHPDLDLVDASATERIWASIHPALGLVLCAVLPDGAYWVKFEWGEELADGHRVIRAEIERDYVYIVTKLEEVDGVQESDGLKIDWNVAAEWVREHGEPVPPEAAQVGLQWLGMGGPKS